ncbi:MAG: galactokinase [Fimbriimonadaceae bacterium]|nr:MAG: galactokinase [Fimbriimonadaceae bacterium]
MSLKVNLDHIYELFRATYSTEPSIVVHAPGRINLIGEHTDYNDGFVLPCAIDQGITIAASPSPDDMNHLLSEQVGLALPFAFGAHEKPGDWAIYAAGVASVIKAKTPIQAVVTSNLPVAGGVSSSAALEVAFATLWNHLDGFNHSPKELALLCQQAENNYVGVNCGIMDMLASACGVADHALLIDTRSLEVQPFAIPSNLCIVLMDTGKARTLAASGYNERRAQCEAAAQVLGIPSLRDAELSDLARLSDEMQIKRARHVISENQRVHDFTAALARQDLPAIGQLMAESHVSLRDDYEVSCPELDIMVQAARSAPGCIGARLTGAGFGGAAVALTESELVGDFIKATEHSYSLGVRTYIASLSSCKPAEGARVLV